MSYRDFSETTLCTDCGAICISGKWQFAQIPPLRASQGTCPDCLRIKESNRAGIRLSGDFFLRHSEEIMNTVKHMVDGEKITNPVTRIMSTINTNGVVIITFTDIYLAHSVGKAIKYAFDNQLDVQFPSAKDVAQSIWNNRSQ